MNKIEYLIDRKIKIKLDGSILRIIAMFTMLVDHFAFMIIGNGVLYGYRPDIHEVALTTVEGKNWYVLYVILRSIGRMSFPIFCFLLVEGFIHTKNLFKYFIRLILIAVVSEIPYNLMCGNSVMYFEKQNTVFTLLLALFMLFIIKKLSVINDERILNIIHILIVAIFSGISYVLHLDYCISGIILIYCIYRYRFDKNLQILCIAIISFFISFVDIGSSLRYFGIGILSAPILFLYNGKEGFLHRYMWIYYLFYPIHFIILYGVVFFTYLKI